MNRLTLTACALLTAGLGAAAAAQRGNDVAPDTAAVVKGNNAFACDLYHELSTEDGNLFFSPYSISNALAMAHVGARRQTAADMATTLHLPLEGQRLNAAFANLIQEVAKPGQQRKFQLTIANRLWGQKDYGFDPQFTKVTKEFYGAGLEELDFTKATEASRQTINAWVAKQTNDKIKDLLPAGSLANDTRLVLTNAIYFKALWKELFPPTATKREDFHLASGKTVQADMMHLVEVLSLYSADKFQVLSLPYQDNELSMLVVLPRKADGLPAVEKELTAKNLAKWLVEMQPHNVTLSLPKFTFTSQFQLKKTLSALGMGIAFGKDADFSGMTTREKLFIDAVVHKAFVAVEEKGTEAAAATAVTMRPLSAQVAPPATFRADHPFVFLIRDNATGSILFMGRVSQP
jgi:serpin B